MRPATGSPAKLYKTSRTDTPWCVVYRDPTKREKSGRAKRIPKWFADEATAMAYRNKLNESLVTEGAAGVTFDATVRVDAMAARRHLDAHGHQAVSLLHLAQRYSAQVTTSSAIRLPIGPELEAFLDEKVRIDSAPEETVKNLRVRCELWFTLGKITTVGGLTRDAAEILRNRDVHPQTRRNDMNAASAFCSYLVDRRRLDVNPFIGMKRPKVPQRKKPVHTADEVGRLLGAAANYANGKWLGSVAALYFVGARPSELKETRFTYGRHPAARIEGGKLVGRANRTVSLMPAATAWLKAAGAPSQVPPLSRGVRTKLCAAAGVAWQPDIPRHTFISNRATIVQNDGQVAREAGTSEDMIHRHYHNLRTLAEARAWAALRPHKTTLTQNADCETIAR